MSDRCLKRITLGFLVYVAAFMGCGVRELQAYEQYTAVGRIHYMLETEDRWTFAGDQLANIKYDGGYGVGVTFARPRLYKVFLGSASFDWYHFQAHGELDYQFAGHRLIESTVATIDRNVDVNRFSAKVTIIDNLYSTLIEDIREDGTVLPPPFSWIIYGIEFVGFDFGLAAEYIHTQRPFGAFRYGISSSTGERIALFDDFGTADYDYYGLGIDYTFRRELPKGLFLLAGISQKMIYTRREDPPEGYENVLEDDDNWSLADARYVHLGYELDRVTRSYGVTLGYQRSDDGPYIRGFKKKGGGTYYLDSFKIPTDSIVFQGFVRF